MLERLVALATRNASGSAVLAVVLLFSRHSSALPTSEEPAAPTVREDEAPSREDDRVSEGDPSPDDEEKPPPIFFLRDGSKVAGFPTIEALRVATRYGTLTVPADDLLRLRLSRRVDETVEGRVAELIERLGSDDFDAREEAMDGLREIGADALSALREARTSDDEERKNRAEILVGELESRASEEAGEHGDEFAAATDSFDELVARRFTIRGRVLLPVFSVESRYGRLELAARDILGVDFRAGGLVERSLSVPGGQTVPKSWLNTKVQVSKGQKLEIRASGSLRVQNYNLTVGPGGTTRYSGNTYKTYPQLALIGRVGKKGREFLIGEGYSGRARDDGPLYLGVVPFRRNYAATGAFKVKISAGE